MDVYLCAAVFLAIPFLFRLVIVERLIAKNSVAKLKAGSSITFAIGAGMMTLLVGLRGATTTDTILYRRYFELNSYPSDMESGFIWLSSQMFNWGFSYNNFQFLIATATLGMIFFVVYQMSSNYSFNLLAIYFLAIPLCAMNTFRQYIAVALFTLVAYAACEKKGIVTKAFVLASIAVGSFIHLTILIAGTFFIIIYLIMERFRYSGKTLFLMGIMILIWSVYAYSTDVAYDLMSWMTETEGLEKYSGFLVAKDYMVEKSKPMFVLSILYALAIIVLSKIVTVKEALRAKDKLLICSIICLGILLGTQASWVGDRIGQYFMPLVSIGVTNFIDFRKLDKYNFYLILVVAGILYLSFQRVYVGNFGNILPYIGVR